MSLEVLAIVVCVLLIIHGLVAFRSGLKKENKSLWFGMPIIGIFRKPNYISNIVWRTIEIIGGIIGLILYLPDLF